MAGFPIGRFLEQDAAFQRIQKAMWGELLMGPSVRRAQRQWQQRVRSRTFEGRGLALLVQHYTVLYRLEAGAWKKYPTPQAWVAEIVDRMARQTGGLYRPAIAILVRNLRRSRNATEEVCEHNREGARMGYASAVLDGP